jgi:serine protease inhibitor ecotin
LKIEEPVQQKRGNPNQSTGLIGVAKSKEKYKAYITYGGTRKNLGSFDTKEQAGMAYDQFVVGKSTEEVSFTLNYPNMSDPEREEALKDEAPVQQKRGKPNQTTGLIGVFKNGKKYGARIRYGGTRKNLGSFDTKEQAGMAYDRFVMDKSTEEVSFTLNYPNGLPTSGTNNDGTDNTDPPTTIKQDPEAELIFHKAKEVQVKSEPEAEF